MYCFMLLKKGFFQQLNHPVDAVNNNIRREQKVGCVSADLC